MLTFGARHCTRWWQASATDGELNPFPDKHPPSTGTVLAKGRFAIDAADDQRLRRLAGADRATAGEAHPGFALVAALGGVGVPVRTLFEACGLGFETGPVLGRCRIEWDRPLTIGENYTVEASLAGLTRKSSRRFGAADHLVLAFAICDEAGRCAKVETTTIVPVAA